MILGSGWDHVRKFMLLSKQDLFIFMPDLHHFADAFSNQVEHLTDAHENAKCTGYNHEQHEDLFLCWAADEAIDRVGTWIE